MTILTVGNSKDYSSYYFDYFDVDTIRFSSNANLDNPVTATFLSHQFDNYQFLNNLTVVGSDRQDRLVINMDYWGASIDASQWSFSGWISNLATGDGIYFIGSENADSIVGTTEGDSISGLGGDDELRSGAGADLLFGDSGNDFLAGGAGADTLSGGVGIDTLSYSGSASGVTIDLAVSTTSGGDAEGDSISGFENVVGTALNDAIRGDASNNVIVGGSGADTLDGAGGIDTLSFASADAGIAVDLLNQSGSSGEAAGDIVMNFENVTGSAYNDTVVGDGEDNTVIGGAGADTMEGGEGVDTLSYEGSSAAVRIDLSTGAAGGGDAKGDVASGFENVVGSNFNDTLRGGGTNNIIAGGAGADTLVGGEGVDMLSYLTSGVGVTVDLLVNTASGGDAEGDLIAGFEGVLGSIHNDTLSGNALANVLAGGDGIDTLSYARSKAGVVIDIESGAASGGNAAGDILSGFENLTGSKFDDNLKGDAGNNVIAGGAGADKLDGGKGKDTLDFANSNSGVTISLLSGSASGGHATGDTISHFEHVVGSGLDDAIIGDAASNELNGSGGDDTLEGGAGMDTLIGGGGFDIASYAGSTKAVRVDLQDGIGTGRGGDAAGDVLADISGVIGSSFDDVLRASDGYNISLWGADGNDILIGEGGVDSLWGGDGDDRINGGGYIDNCYGESGNDTFVNRGRSNGDNIFGGSGIDTLDLSGIRSVKSCEINLKLGLYRFYDTFTLQSVENVLGSNKTDFITGKDGENTIYGMRGDDAICGGAGADTLRGGDGVDTLLYAHSSVGVAIDLLNKTAAGGDAEGDSISGFENVTGSGRDDFIMGDGKANVISGGAGADTVNGGNGFDTLSYADSGAPVFVDLLKHKGSGGDSSGDIIFNFEMVIGSAFGDRLYGDSTANVLKGGNGNDVLEGGTGADVLIGGEGVDTLSYQESGAGVDINLSSAAAAHGDASGDSFSSMENVLGSDFDDTLFGNGNVNELSGGAGDDFIDGGASSDVLIGGSGFDTLSYGNAGTGVGINLLTNDAYYGAAWDQISGFENVIGSGFEDTLYGDHQANTLVGGKGNDTLRGQAGGDILLGGAGYDDLSGGGGDDVFLYETVENSVDVIYNFSGAGAADGDRINLWAIDANPGGADNTFIFGGTTATPHGVWYQKFDGVLVIRIDSDGDVLTAELQIVVDGASTLAQGDFVL